MLPFNLHSKFDKLFYLIKWPAALFSIFMVPGIISAFYHGKWNWSQLLDNYAFWGGIAGYFLLWKFFFRNPIWGTWFSTLEHELTHALFALLTFHRVTGISTSYRNGGLTTYLGKGNWLITLSPYFFPTFSMVAIGLSKLFGFSPFTRQLVLGITISYHLISTFGETHLGQSDLQEAGIFYSFLLLPGLNLYFYALIVAYMGIGFDSISRFHSIVGNSLKTMLF
ncbi:MAG: M50 family metallopeptidase [Myxococcota bacterium]